MFSYLLKFLFQNNVEYTPLTCLFTVREESGLWGARNVDKKDLGSPEIGFNTDGSSPYEIITSAVGAERWSVEIIGKGSHAGVAPNKGISSSIVASIALSKTYEDGWFGLVEKNGLKKELLILVIMVIKMEIALVLQLIKLLIM